MMTSLFDHKRLYRLPKLVIFLQEKAIFFCLAVEQQEVPVVFFGSYARVICMSDEEKYLHALKLKSLEVESERVAYTLHA